MDARMQDHEQIQRHEAAPARKGENEPGEHEGQIQAKRQDAVQIADGAGVAGGPKPEVLQSLVEAQP